MTDCIIRENEIDSSSAGVRHGHFLGLGTWQLVWVASMSMEEAHRAAMGLAAVLRALALKLKQAAEYHQQLLMMMQEVEPVMEAPSLEVPQRRLTQQAALLKLLLRHPVLESSLAGTAEPVWHSA